RTHRRRPIARRPPPSTTYPCQGNDTVRSACPRPIASRYRRSTFRQSRVRRTSASRPRERPPARPARGCSGDGWGRGWTWTEPSLAAAIRHLSLDAGRKLSDLSVRNRRNPMLDPSQLDSWHRDGFIVLKAFVPPDIGWRMAEETIAAI